MDNLLSNCGLVDAKIRASDKDLPVIIVRSMKFSIRMMHSSFSRFPHKIYWSSLAIGHPGLGLMLKVAAIKALVK